MSNSLLKSAIVAALVITCLSSLFAADPPKRIEFNRHIRPILSDNCFFCHGPDKNQRQAELRLDHEPAAEKKIIVPGNPNESALLRRIISENPDEVMPPPDSGRSLTKSQIELIKRWIAQGGDWQRHWSLIPPKPRPLPQVQMKQWPLNPIDVFVLARLEAEGLRPSEQADRATLIRRATLSLTGLPPTPSEIDRFLQNETPDAYERLVGRLLASPAYGERMASPWLDAARYADTSGYQNDGPREMWRWRDWVIDAFNRNQPFDQFTVEQLAGDLLPNPTLSQLIATGFNRNHRGNAEGGIIPEEYQVEYVVDRVETTGTVWLGLTLGCARCHDHKFDPIDQREFYSFYDYFNRVPEYGRAIKEGNSPPFLKAPNEGQSAKLAKLDAELRVAERDQLPRLRRAVEDSLTQWQQSLAPADIRNLPAHWTPADGEVLHVDPGHTAKHWESKPGELKHTEGPLGPAVMLDGESHIDAGNTAKFGYFDKFSLSVWLNAAQPTGTVVSKTTDSARADGYALELERGRLQVNLVKRWLDDAVRVETKRPIPQHQWVHVVATYDGSRLAEGIRVYVDGEPVPLVVKLDAINQSFANDEPFRIGGGSGAERRFQGGISEVRVFDRVLTPQDVRILAVSTSLRDILENPLHDRSVSEAALLFHYHLHHDAKPSLRKAWQRVRSLREQRSAFWESLPTVMVMKDVPRLRNTHVLKRGEYDKPGDAVTAGIPVALTNETRMPAGNRLELARWIVEAQNPLTARVVVNRAWQLHFGTGLVKTTEDFGSQGEQPSHPDLLDWLALDFQRDWNVKRLHRQIVTSAVYRQSSRHRAGLKERDPDNRLLARGPRFRLHAGVVRDQALAAAGLLVRRLRGPSVKPYQPEGLWKEIASAGKYPQDHGSALYRRSLYTYRKRTVAPPVMAAFDASSRETCIVRPARTNTPLQALALLNETGFVEAARKLAERATHNTETPAAQIRHACRLVLSRQPTDVEFRVLSRAHARYATAYQAYPDAAKSLLETGESQWDTTLDERELAALTMTCSLLLNLDESVTLE